MMQELMEQLPGNLNRLPPGPMNLCDKISKTGSIRR